MLGFTTLFKLDPPIHTHSCSCLFSDLLIHYLLTCFSSVSCMHISDWHAGLISGHQLIAFVSLTLITPHSFELCSFVFYQSVIAPICMHTFVHIGQSSSEVWFIFVVKPVYILLCYWKCPCQSFTTMGLHSIRIPHKSFMSPSWISPVTGPLC